MRPFSTVDDPNFNALIQCANSSLKVMSRRALMKCIQDKTTLIRNQIKIEFEKAQFVSTIADIWATKHDSYLGVAATFLDISFVRHVRLLACKPFPSPHTGERIAEGLSQIHKEFGLSLEKLVGTTTDNASNNLKAFKDFGLQLIDEEELEKDENSEDEQEEEEEENEVEIVNEIATNQENHPEEEEHETSLLSRHFRFVFIVKIYN